MNVPEIDPKALREELDGSNPPTILDVRDPHELSESRLPDEIVNVPLGELDRDVARLDPETSYVVVCRVGGRSAQATAFLLEQGFTDVRNLAGGMNSYAREVDPTLKQY